jgi:hypothetical protein
MKKKRYLTALLKRISSHSFRAVTNRIVVIQLAQGVHTARIRLARVLQNETCTYSIEEQRERDN